MFKNCWSMLIGFGCLCVATAVLIFLGIGCIILDLKRTGVVFLVLAAVAICFVIVRVHKGIMWDETDGTLQKPTY